MGRFAFQIQNLVPEIDLIENLLARGCAEQKSTPTGIVDAAGRTLRVIADAADRVVPDEEALEEPYP